LSGNVGSNCSIIRRSPKARRCLTLTILALLLAPVDVCAEEPSQSAFVDAKCFVPSDEHWTPQEKFVWERICIGKVADFNKEPSYGGRLDPRMAAGLPESRIIRPSFLETILLDEKYRSAITRHGVRIFGGRFTETIDLQNAELRNELWLQRCLLEKGANFSWLRSPLPIGLAGSKVGGKLDMYGLRVDSNLFLHNEAEFADINLRGAHIGQTLDLSTSKVTGLLDMYGLEVGSNLFMKANAEFAEVNLPGAHIGHTLDLSKSKVTGRLQMDSLQVGVYLLMREGEFAEVILLQARVPNQLALEASKLTGQLQAYGIRVGADLLMYRSEFAAVNLANAQVGGPLNFRGSTFHEKVNLTGAHIDGPLDLGSGKGAARWSRDAILMLRNAKFDVIPSLSDNWPNKLDIEGLTYREVGSVSKDFQDWFNRLEHYSPQPYEQLAVVLQNQGNGEMATAVRYAARDRERRESSGWTWAWLTLLDWVIGYGCYAHWSLGWALILIFLGAIILRLSGEGPKNRMPIGLTYSFDMLLPLIRLRDKHYEIDLQGPARYYFYAHKILGWVLASFLIAGLSGLTK
jgi:hypothetical protein